jgi:hypothetical protein
MDDIQTRIAELENKAADCELLSVLAADTLVRAKNRRLVIEMQMQAWALREAYLLRFSS